jgi:radical SAM superfamily enzyme YgiQ (UPF0313 family)
MKILLIAINAGRQFTPLALLYLKSFLLNDKYLKERISVDIKEYDLFDEDDLILHEINKYNPQVVGFSCYVWNINKILTLTNKLKKITKKTAIILGGPQVSPMAKALLEDNSQIDAIVRGEGEVSFLELISAILDDHSLFKEISGITHRFKGGVEENHDRGIIADLDSIPSVYRSDFISLEDREVCLETQRGCVFKCDFCYYNKNFNRVRCFSIERIKRELTFLLKQNVKSIYLMDPVFNVDASRAKEICRYIVKMNKKKIPFHAEIRAELVDNELAGLFHRANVKYLEIGLQSSEGKVLQLVNRGLDAKKFAYGINLLKKHNLITEVHLIFGLPGDTFHSFMKSLEFTLNLEPKRLSIFRLQVLPGTEICRKSKELGILYEDDPPHHILQSRSLPFNKLIELLKIINSLDLFRSKLAVKYLRKEIGIGLLDVIGLWIDWLDDDAFLLKSQHSDILIEKLNAFMQYLCVKNGIDFMFYENMLRKDIEYLTQMKQETDGGKIAKLTSNEKASQYVRRAFHENVSNL